jgi:hypothetical protein
MSESDARRTFGSAWNTRPVSGTVESAHLDDSGKGVKVSVDVMWDLPAGPKLRNVNLRSIAAGDAPRTARVNSLQLLGAAGGAADANVERDEGDRHRASSVYSVPRPPVLPNPADNLADATSCAAHGALWDEEDVLQPLGGDVPRRVWTLQTAVGESTVEGETQGWLSLLGDRTTTSWQYFHRTS